MEKQLTLEDLDILKLKENDVVIFRLPEDFENNQTDTKFLRMINGMLLEQGITSIFMYNGVEISILRKEGGN